jgi:superfamily II RNA helicase
MYLSLSLSLSLSVIGYIQENNVTDVGRLIASINAENPLWVGSLLLYEDR